MNNSSLAAQAVANGPMTAAPPAFNGQGWLVVFNMGIMTAAGVLGAMLVIRLLGDHLRLRQEEPRWTPRKVWRLFGILFGTCFTLRSGGEAMVLWGWNPYDPSNTAVYLFIKRLIDPFAIVFGLASLALFTLSREGMDEQLSKQPWPLNMWIALPEMRRAAWIVGLSFIAALGVVATR